MSQLSRLLKESSELREKAQALLNTQTSTGKPKIVVWGLMNAGKSYLLNMLTQHIEHEFFKTNDIRETAEIHKYETAQSIYIDTPGLDARLDDNLIAFHGVKQADIVLFVHQLQGELERVEISFLQELKKSFGQYADKHIIIILSKIDKETDEKVQQIEKKVLEQCRSVIGFNPKCFKISNTRYQTGIKKQKQGLIKQSHIDDLKLYLENELFTTVEAVRKERIEQEKSHLLYLLKANRKQLMSADKTLLSEYKQLANKVIGRFHDEMRTFVEQKKTKHDEL